MVFVSWLYSLHDSFVCSVFFWLESLFPPGRFSLLCWRLCSTFWWPKVVCWCLSRGLGQVRTLSCLFTVSRVTYWQSRLTSVPWVCALSCGDKTLSGPYWTRGPGCLQSGNPVGSGLNSSLITIPGGCGALQSATPYLPLSEMGLPTLCQGREWSWQWSCHLDRLASNLLSYLPCHSISRCTRHDRSRPFQGITGPFPQPAAHPLHSPALSHSLLTFQQHFVPLFPVHLGLYLKQEQKSYLLTV